jgi:K+-transporting ATPase ATPase B chain
VLSPEPWAPKGVRYRPVGATALPRDNILIYGVGRVIVPFIRIKLINLTLIGLGKA